MIDDRQLRAHARVYIETETSRLLGAAELAEVVRYEIETLLIAAFGCAYAMGSSQATMGSSQAMASPAHPCMDPRTRQLAIARGVVGCVRHVDNELDRIFGERERTIIGREELSHAIERVFVFAHTLAEIEHQDLSMWGIERLESAVDTLRGDKATGGLFVLRVPIDGVIIRAIGAALARGLKVEAIDALLVSGLSPHATIETLDFTLPVPLDPLPTQLPTPLEIIEPLRFVARTGCFCGGTGRWWLASSACTHCKGTGRKLCSCTRSGSCCSSQPS